ncbi:TolC family outer membrane protein [Sulfurivermis fontis]|uniref:TolC family outer membrane protein n=1 Tax=Sulfurivermis fontis TaxID=1972068 RepID=UPI000FDCCB1C|nr:TolC family outer membrane protein [Sulfurivermis fontis]
MSNSVARVLALALLAGAAAAQGEDLRDVYRLAQESDPQLRAAEAGHRAALEARPLSRAALLPSINFTAQTQRNAFEYDTPAYPDNEYNSSSYSLSLRQALYHHEYYVQLRQADAGIAQADAQYGAAKQALIVRVAEAYFNLLSAEDNLRFAQAEKTAIAQQLRQTQQRFEVGLSAITDVHEAQAGYDAAVAQEIVAQNQLENAREVLREITGRDHTALAPLAGEIPLQSPDPASIDKWEETALQQNLQLLAAEAATHVAREEMKRREAGHYPTLDIVASHNWSDTSESDLSGSEYNSNIIGLQLNLPLYAGGGVSASTRQAAHLYTQAQEGLEQTRRATVRQTRDAYLGVTAGISTVQARRQALSSAKTALQATQAGFEVGTRTAVEVLNSQRELFRAQRDYARARYDYALSTLRLKQAAGILSDADLEYINSWLQ